MNYPSTVSVTSGVGTGIAFDDVSGAKFQAVKIDVGAAGASALLGAANPLPATVIQGGLSVSSTNPMAAFLGLISTDLTEVAINFSTIGDNDVIIAQGAGNKIRVWMWWFKVNGAGTGVNLKFRDGAADYHPALPFNDKDSWVMGFSGRPWFTGTANTKLAMNLSAGIQISGRLYYTVGA